jgi:hypothetical protein
MSHVVIHLYTIQRSHTETTFGNWYAILINEQKKYDVIPGGATYCRFFLDSLVETCGTH